MAQNHVPTGTPSSGSGPATPVRPTPDGGVADEPGAVRERVCHVRIHRTVRGQQLRVDVREGVLEVGGIDDEPAAHHRARPRHLGE